MATCPGQRTMEATRGNGYAPAWGSLVMMMMMMNVNMTFLQCPVKKSRALNTSHFMPSEHCTSLENTHSDSTHGALHRDLWETWPNQCWTMEKLTGYTTKQKFYSIVFKLLVIFTRLYIQLQTATLTTNFIRGDLSTAESGTFTTPMQLLSDRPWSRCHTSTTSGKLNTCSISTNHKWQFSARNKQVTSCN